MPLGQEAGAALPVLPLADIASAMFAALGIVSALLARTRSGKGAQVDVSMLDSLVSWMTPFLVPPLNGLPTRPLPPLDPGYGVFATADGRQITLSIAGEDHMWAALCDLLALPHLAALTERQRDERAAEIGPQLREAMLRQPHDVLCSELEARRIAFGPVLQLDQVLRHPQMVARRMTVQADSPTKAQTFVRQPLQFNGEVPATVRPVPTLGQHNDQLLTVVRADQAGVPAD